MTNIILVLSATTLLYRSSFGQTDCASITDQTACDAEDECYYVVDTAFCGRSGECSSDCTRCTTEDECLNDGLGGGVNNNCAWDSATSTCAGAECNTNCAECVAPNDCTASRFPPLGCEFVGGEDWYVSVSFMCYSS